MRSVPRHRHCLETLEPRWLLSDSRLPTITTLDASTTESTYTTAITFSTSVACDDPVISGTVFLMEGNTILTSFLLDSTAHAETSYISLTTGTHILTAQFTGDTTRLPSLSDPLTVTVDPVPTFLTFSTLPASVDFGKTVQFTATASSSFNTPRGNAIVENDDTTLATVPLNSLGQALFTVAIPQLGDQTLTVLLDPQDPFAPTSATTEVITVNRAHAPLVLEDATTTSSYTLTASIPFAGTVPPSGNVTFLDGAATLATLPLAGGRASFSLRQVSSLTHDFSAIYTGDADFFGATSVFLARTVHLPAPVKLTGSAGYTRPGQLLTVTASVSAPIRSPFALKGSIVFRDGTRTLAKVPLVHNQATFATSDLATGQHALTATFVGDTHFRSTASPVLPAIITSQYVVDLLILYTPAAVTDVGGPAILHNTILQAVRDTNKAMLNSRIPVTIRPVHIDAVNYTETGSFATDLDNLSTDGDGQLDEAFPLREKYGADLVTLFVGSGDLAGLAYQMTSATSASNPDLAFSVVLADEAAGPDYVLAHELGHNFGASHDIAHDSGASIAPDSHGYRFTAKGTVYHDIMSYDPGITIPYYSNPDIRYLGVPIGKDGQANAARVITWTAPIVAAYRKTKVSWKLPVLV
ncbi:MAG: Ig-like domain repeat protein [Tepidisphaeraceae bacterium]